MRLTVVISFLVSAPAFCQLLPDLVNDQGWVASPALTDEFNSGSTYDANKWTWNPGYSEESGSTCLQNDNNNISVQSGYIRLALREESSTCSNGSSSVNHDYTAGNLYGLNEQQYGYFEVRYRISDIPTPPATQEGLAASAWLWRSWYPFNCIWSEIDLSEVDVAEHRQTCNVIYDPNECDVSFPGLIPIPSSVNMRCVDYPCVPEGDMYLSPGWHTFSAVWYPNSIAIYVDGVLENSTDIGCPGMEPLNWILGPSSGEFQFSTGITANTQLPFNMDVDYVRVYHLQNDCSTSINTCAFYFSGHDDKVKNSITIGGSGCANTMPTTGSGSKVYLRAVNYVELNGEFTVPLGAELVVETTGTCL